MERIVLGDNLADIHDSASSKEIAGNLRDIRLCNRILGGTGVVLHHLTRLIGDSPLRQPVKILDMATGSADIPVAVVKWARKRHISVRITALDRHPIVAKLAGELAKDFREITVEQQDIHQLKHHDCSFDFSICSQILHHMDNEGAARILRTANRLGALGVVVSELQRRSLSICLSAVLCGLMRNRLARLDARVSFRNAFTKSDLVEIAQVCDLPFFEVYEHGPFRLALVVDKRTAMRRHEKSVSQAAASVLI